MLFFRTRRWLMFASVVGISGPLLRSTVIAAAHKMLSFFHWKFWRQLGEPPFSWARDDFQNCIRWLKAIMLRVCFGREVVEAVRSCGGKQLLI